MSSAEGILAYGYDLAMDWGFDAHALSPAPEYPAWMLAPGGDGVWDLADDLPEAAMGVLATARMSPEGPTLAVDEVRAGDASIGLRFIGSGCEGVYASMILAAVVYTAGWGDARPIDLRVPDHADRDLKWALRVLGLRPAAAGARWLLAAYYG